MFLFAEEWSWSKRDLILLSGGEILSLIKKINRKRKIERENKKTPSCPLLTRTQRRK